MLGFYSNPRRPDTSRPAEHDKAHPRCGGEGDARPTTLAFRDRHLACPAIIKHVGECQAEDQVAAEGL